MSESGEPHDPVKMTIKALVMDPISNMPVVILEQADQNAYLPIWIGVCEANSIALELEGVTTPRPMTHDLIGSLVEAMGYSVDHVFIHSLADSVFLASIRLTDTRGSSRDVDSRPSDALAIALRAKADVLVSPQVLEQALVAETSQEDAIKMILERMRPEDMGEYEM
jgi:bifunctional DNase/RNase